MSGTVCCTGFSLSGSTGSGTLGRFWSAFKHRSTASCISRSSDWPAYVCRSTGTCASRRAPNCMVRLSNTGPERPNGNRFKLEALTVRPGELFMGEGTHRVGSERDYAISGGTQGSAH